MLTKRLRLFHLLLICLFIYIPAVSLLAEDTIKITGSSELPVYIDADVITYDKETDTYHAKGNVVVIQGGSVIISEKMEVDMLSNLGIAEEDVELIDEGGNILKGDRLEFEIDTKTGIVKNGKLFYKKENFYIKGEEIRKTDKETYDIKKGEFTTCDCDEGESPTWKFSASEANVTVGEYLRAWHTFFHIKDVPVLYSPFVTVPVKRERQTGFLFPGFGYSELRGFKMDNAFFWAISDNTDATFYLDIETKRGLGKGAEYRYVLSRQTEGEIYIYHFKEDDIKRVREFRSGSDNLSRPETAGDNRWIFKLKHKQAFPYNVAFKADINRVSDDEYFIDFAKKEDERALTSLESNLSLSKQWDNFNLVAQFRYYDNLLSAEDKDTLQKLPETTLTGTSQQIFKTPFYFALESSFTNFYRETGTKGERLDVYPRISLPLRPGGYVEFTPSIGYRNTHWWADDDSTDTNVMYYNRYIYDLQADLTTTFVRIFTLEGDELNKMKHTIRPKISYTFIPYKDQHDLPSFDGIDRIGKSSTINYSINTILTGKFFEEKNTYTRDIVYFDISQSFDINEARRARISTEDKRKPLSDIVAEAILKPFQWMTLSAKEQYDVYDNWFEKHEASLGLNDKRGDSLGMSYRYTRNDTEYLDTSAIIKATETINLTYKLRYSYNDTRGLEKVYGIDYHKQCWGALFTYTQKLEENIFMVTFNLLGLGQVGSVSGGMK